MPYYRRRGPDTAIPDPLTSVSALAVPPMALTRRLLPFPGAEGRQAASESALGDERIANAVEAVGPEPILATAAETGAVPRTPMDQAADLLPRAAEILDEEMARGALAAKSLAPLMPPASSGLSAPLSLEGPGAMPSLSSGALSGAGIPLYSGLPDAGTLTGGAVPRGMSTGDWAKDLYAFVERFAALLPRQPMAPDPEGVSAPPALQAAKPVRAGQAATLSMQLTNDETQPLVLNPVATALISENGAQMPAQCVTCAPASLTLAPGQGTPLTITVAVPADSASGRYTGLIVLAGAARLRALIDVEVAAAAP